MGNLRSWPSAGMGHSGESSKSSRGTRAGPARRVCLPERTLWGCSAAHRNTRAINVSGASAAWASMLDAAMLRDECLSLPQRLLWNSSASPRASQATADAHEPVCASM